MAVDSTEGDRCQALRFATPDSLDAYMNRAPHTVTPVSAQAAIEESFFLGLRLNRGVDLDNLRAEFSASFKDCHPERSEGSAVSQQSPKTLHAGSFREGHDFSRATSAGEKTAFAAEAIIGSQQEFSQETIATWESAIKQCIQDGLLEQQGTTLRLNARGRLLSNEVFARFLVEETKVGTGHVKPR